MISAMPLDVRDVLCGDTTEAPALWAAIQRRWACQATLAQTVPVRAQLDGHFLDVVVHVFDLEDCSKATRAYAWTAPIEDTVRRRVQISLQIGPIKSPTDAVWAAVADEVRAHRLATRLPAPAKIKAAPRQRWLAPKLHALGF